MFVALPQWAMLPLQFESNCKMPVRNRRDLSYYTVIYWYLVRVLFNHWTISVSLYSCGNTTKTVPCGREKKTKLPKCNRPCKIPSRCHHINEHKCHIGECPACFEKCLLETNCNHPCVVRCHAAVKVQIVDKNFKPAGPWDIQPEKFEIQKLPHPKCEIKVSVECIGGHEVALWPCHESMPSSCGRICGRQLFCGNHVCEKICHAVADKTSTKVC